MRQSTPRISNGVLLLLILREGVTETSSGESTRLSWGKWREKQIARFEPCPQKRDAPPSSAPGQRKGNLSFRQMPPGLPA